jgi:hypothetical protein
LQLEQVEATKTYFRGAYEGHRVDEELFLSWSIKARHLISMACGTDSTHYKQFVKCEDSHSMYTTNYDIMKNLRAVFQAAKEDYEGGFLNSFRNLVQAEVFSNELDQARELLSAKYKAPAAVVAGVVLETTLRQLCTDNKISPGKLNRMNEDLAKSGIYNSIWQKKITALADIRNKAAHGQHTEFNDCDVLDMISQVENFLSIHL